MATAALAVSAIAGLVGAGTATVGAVQQHDAAKKAKKQQEEQLKEQKAQALAERKKKIDALRDSAVGLTGGRRTLLSGAETGLSSGYGTNETLG